MITDTECLKTFGEPFVASEWILFGDPDREMLCRVEKRKGMSALLIEEDEMAAACKRFAIKHGVRMFRSMEEVKQAFDLDGKVCVAED